MDRRQFIIGTGAISAGALAAPSRTAHAADDVVIGVIYPLTGNGAAVGLDAKAAYEVAAKMINDTHAPIGVAMGKGGGLDRLGGAKIKLVFADSQNDPQKARAEAERLITQDKAVAIVGSYTSATGATISQVTERYEVPYISADNSSPSLNQRGLKWFFRTGPHDEMFTKGMFDFLAEIAKKTGKPAKSIALFYEDSIFGTDSSNVQRKLATAAGMTIAADIRYRASSPSLSTEAQKLKAANADVLLPSSYTSDAILILKAMNEIGYKPKAILAQAAGFQESAFMQGAGVLAEGAMSRSSFALDADKLRPAIPVVNGLYKAHNNKDMNDNTSREITALLVLADAINRAGSAKPEDIRKALIATDMPGSATIMPWAGVKFDETGQNTLCNPVIQQVFDGAYKTIWPFDLAAREAVWNVGG
ncbi:MAG: ABC transporter substrate-binding protein [Alphaproteobacteria bacterium]|nr:ABC transporter substrate-binding protein [Alphaproteobacteria bacterium]